MGRAQLIKLALPVCRGFGASPPSAFRDRAWCRTPPMHDCGRGLKGSEDLLGQAPVLQPVVAALEKQVGLRLTGAL